MLFPMRRPGSYRALWTTALVTAMGSPALATHYWRVPTGGLYATPSNWSTTSSSGGATAYAPRSNDDVIFDLDAAYTVTLGANAGTYTTRVDNGNLTLQASPGATVGYTTRSTAIGTTGHTASLTLGAGLTYDASSGTYVGAGGNGTLTLLDGSNFDSTALHIGYGSDVNDGNGLVTIHRGAMVAPYTGFQIGTRGTGTLRLTDGASLSNARFYVGSAGTGYGNAVGTLELLGPDTQITAMIQTAIYGQGVVNIKDGAGLTTSGVYYAGFGEAGGPPTLASTRVDGTGSTFTTTSYFVAYAGNASLEVTHNATANLGTIEGAVNDGDVNTLTVGSGGTINFSYLRLGAGTTNINVLAGGKMATSIVADFNAAWPYEEGATTNLTVDGPGATWVSPTISTLNGTNKLNIVLSNDGTLALGPTKSLLGGANTTLKIDGGTLDALNASDTVKLDWRTGTIKLATTNAKTIGQGYFLTPNVTLDANTNLELAGALVINADGTLTIGRGTLKTSGITLLGGTIFANGGFDTDTYNVTSAAGTISGPVTGSDTLTATGKLNLGSIAVTDGYAHQGPLVVGGNAVALLDADTAELGTATSLSTGGRLVTVNGATLASGRSLTASGSARIDGEFVNQGTVAGPTGAGEYLTFTGDVSGAGAFTGNIKLNAGFAPGNSPAQVSVQNVVFNFPSTLSLEIGGTEAGTEYDQLLAGGSVTLGGGLQVDLINGFVPQIGDTFTLVTANALAGGFDPEAVQLPSLPDGTWRLTQTGQTLTLAVAAVPEPATLAAAGVASLLLLRRTRRGN